MSNPKPLYDEAIRAYESKNFQVAERLAKRLISEYPESNVADAGEKILASIAKRNAQQEQEAQQAKDKKKESPSDEVYSEDQWNEVTVSPAIPLSSQYATTRALASFFAFIGWVVVAAGAIIAFLGLSQYGLSQYGFVGLVSGLGVSFLGLIQVMGGQLIRATVDMADNTQRILNALNRDR